MIYHVVALWKLKPCFMDCPSTSINLSQVTLSINHMRSPSPLYPGRPPVMMILPILTVFLVSSVFSLPPVPQRRLQEMAILKTGDGHIIAQVCDLWQNIFKAKSVDFCLFCPSNFVTEHFCFSNFFLETSYPFRNLFGNSFKTSFTETQYGDTNTNWHYKYNMATQIQLAITNTTWRHKCK